MGLAETGHSLYMKIDMPCQPVDTSVEIIENDRLPHFTTCA